MSQKVVDGPSSSFPIAMLDAGELECVVCCHNFNRSERCPRLLHCFHTFCVPCLDRMSMVKGMLRTTSCPLCRWITCTDAIQDLNKSMYINWKIWGHIPEKSSSVEDLVFTNAGGFQTIKKKTSNPSNSFKTLFSCVGKAR